MSTEDQVLELFIEDASGNLVPFDISQHASAHTGKMTVLMLRSAINAALSAHSKVLSLTAPIFSCNVNEESGRAENHTPVLRAIDPAKAYCFREADIVKEVAEQLPAQRARSEDAPIASAELFETISKVAVDGEFLVLPVEVFGEFIPTAVLRRRCIDSFYDKYLATQGEFGTTIRRIALIGTPGIGKTTALAHILWRCIAEHDATRQWKFIVFVLPAASRCWVYDLERRTCFKKTLSGLPILVSSLNGEMSVTNTLVLHDLAAGTPLTTPDFATILATSPKESKYNAFLKSGAGRQGLRYYIPLFEDREMAVLAERLGACGQLNFTPEHPVQIHTTACTTWRQVAHFMDNVPRDVFFEYTAWSLVIQYIDTVYGDGSSRGAAKEQADITINDRLTRYIPSISGTGFTIAFRRGYVSDRVAAGTLRKILKNLTDVVLMTGNGCHFETAIHSVMSMHPQIVSGDGAFVPLNDLANGIKLVLPSKRWREVVVEGSATYTLRHKVYYLPAAKNFAVVDSLMFQYHRAGDKLRMICFQMTIADEHMTTVSKVATFIKNLDSRFKHGKFNGRDVGLHFELEPTGQLCVRYDVDPEGASRPVEVCVVFVVRDDGFGAQALEGHDGFGAEAPGGDDVSKAVPKFWSRVLQYRCTARYLLNAIDQLSRPNSGTPAESTFADEDDTIE